MLTPAMALLNHSFKLLYLLPLPPHGLGERALFLKRKSFKRKGGFGVAPERKKKFQKPKFMGKKTKTPMGSFRF